MTEHISESRLERFRVRALPVSELTSIAKHLDGCPSCNQRFVDILRSRRGAKPLKITLAPEFQLRQEHVDYDQLVRLADKTMDASEREMLDVHLKVCAPCQEDVRSFLAFREQLDREETKASAAIVAPILGRDKTAWLVWWRGLAWKPAYAAVVLLIGMALVIGVAVLLKRRAANLEAKQNQPAPVNVGQPIQTPTPESRIAINASPTPEPAPSAPPRTSSATVKNRKVIRKPEDVGAVVALNDGQRTITVNSLGNVSGLENIPQETQRNVRETLIAQNIEQPEIAKELAPTSITLRGPATGQPFKLLSPARTVVLTDRPSFEWEKLPGATAYRVVVGDMRGHEAARSEELSLDQTRWTPTKPLKRGEIYAWNVIAVVDGKEIVSPGGSASEMKFKVLSASSAEELEQLKKAGSPLALGVFYAREGLLDEAEREFQILVKQNPNSPLPKKLLKVVQSWKLH